MRKSHPLLAGIETVPPYRHVTGQSLYAIRPPAMQIDQFLPVGGVMGITSYPGVGKTWLALTVAKAIASGQPFLERFATIRGGVLFVGSDSSLYDYARQWTRLTKATPNASEVYEPVRFLIQSTFMFENTEEVRKLISTHRNFEWGEPTMTPDGPARERGFHTIIFDTLSRLTRANQNDNTEMEEVFRNIRWIAEATDAAIILLHHNSKKSEYNDGADWRGAMSQIGALDSWVQLSHARKDKYLIGCQFKKFRGITPEDFSYRMEVDNPLNARLYITDEPVTLEQRLQHDPTAEAVKEYIQKNPNKRACEIRDALWPRFEEGVASGNTTVRYPNQKKLLDAINNRLAALIGSGDVRRDINDAGKSVYVFIGKLPEPAPVKETEKPAKATKRGSTKPKRKKAKNARA